jgi:hypothetical protein
MYFWFNFEYNNIMKTIYILVFLVLSHTISVSQSVNNKATLTCNGSANAGPDVTFCPLNNSPAVQIGTSPDLDAQYS